MAHAKLSPSSAYRWMNCPGSIKLIDSLPPELVQRSSEHADEGSAAHKLAETCLRSGRNAASFLDWDINGFTVDNDMADAAQVFIDEVRRVFELVGGCLYIEYKFDLNWLFPGMFGTADAVVFNPETRVLHVFDYKHGAGVVVEPDENPQQLLYALGASKDKRASEIHLVIVQPRANHDDGPIRAWTTTPEYLDAFAGKIAEAAFATEDENPVLQSGPQCRFCPAVAICPALKARAAEEARVEFGEVAKVEEPRFVSAVELTPEQIANILDNADYVKAWLSSIQRYAQGLAEAGKAIPGYKLTQRRGHRKWVDPKSLKEALTNYLPEEAIYEAPKIKSPAQIEKLLPKSYRSILTDLAAAPDNGVELVRESSKRIAIAGGSKSAIAEFDAL